MKRARLLARLAELAEGMLQGSLSQTTRTCGVATCRCHRRGERHGPHTYLTFKTPRGSSSLYVPVEAAAEASGGVEAWGEFWKVAVRLSALNRAAAAARWRRRRRRHRPRS